MEFLLAADALKGVSRTCRIADGSRVENSAEHSWHVALMAIVLAEHCPHPVEIGRVVQLLTIHDLVEVYAGDTLIYDEGAVSDQGEREQLAAERLFGLLPSDQRDLFHSFWCEFETGETAEARFARAVDALAPAWLHWGEHASPTPEELTAKRVLERKAPRLESYPALHALLEKTVRSAADRGLIRH